MRIVGGEWGGRTLVAPPGTVTRPTSDALRESIFNILEHGLGHSPQRVLDLFAGTGALSFEALSRGAISSVLMESDAKALAAIQKNRSALGLGEDRVRIFNNARIDSWGKSLSVDAAAFQPFDTIFCDPPYEKGLVPKAVDILARAEVPVSPEACLVVEISVRETLPAFKGWRLVKERRRGTTGVLFYRRGE